MQRRQRCAACRPWWKHRYCELVSLLCWLLSATTTAAAAVADEQQQLEFTDELLRWTVTAVRLSLVSYTDDRSVLADYALQMYRDNPDQAAVTQIDGVCFAAFRGTVFFNWKDLTQNLKLGNVDVCAHGACCAVEKGFYDGYNTNYRERLEENVRRCTASCDDGQCPLVLTGHSQGGAIASVAALYFADLDPTVITFGQMAAIDKPCTLINSDKYYRFENSRAGYFGPTYDPIPNLPYFASHFGHQIMLGDDATGVAYIGKDTHIHFRPYDTDRAFRTHRLVPKTVGYLNRIEHLAAHYEPRVLPTAMNDTVYDCFLKNSSSTNDSIQFFVDEEEESGTASPSPTESPTTSAPSSLSPSSMPTVDAEEVPLQSNSSKVSTEDLDAIDNDVTASSALRGSLTQIWEATGGALLSMEEEDNNATTTTTTLMFGSGGDNTTVVTMVVETQPMASSNDTLEETTPADPVDEFYNETMMGTEPEEVLEVPSNSSSNASSSPMVVAGGETREDPPENTEIGDMVIAGSEAPEDLPPGNTMMTTSPVNTTEDAPETVPSTNSESPGAGSSPPVQDEEEANEKPLKETEVAGAPQVPRPKYLVRSNGFIFDTRCSKDVECVSRNCRRKRCDHASTGA